MSGRRPKGKNARAKSPPAKSSKRSSNVRKRRPKAIQKARGSRKDTSISSKTNQTSKRSNRMTDTKNATGGSPPPGKLTPQSQGPGQGMAAGSGYRMGPGQDEIESPVQKARDKREDLETSKVDSGGDKIFKRYGEPASIEEKKAAGDVIPEGDHPFAPGVPGVHGPGTYTPTEEKKAEAKKEK